jgi:hypothetical protein
LNLNLILDEDAQVQKDDDIPPATSDPETQTSPQEPEMSDQDGSTPATDMVPEPATSDDVVHEAAEQVDSDEPAEAVVLDSVENNDDEDEFIVISQDQAPIELAEEYPQVEVFPHLLLI